MRKAIIILSVFFVCNFFLATFYSCVKEYPCGPFKTDTAGCVQINDLTADVISLGDETKVDSGHAVVAEKLRIEVNFRGGVVTCKNTYPYNPFITQVYACSPPQPIYVQKDKVVNISIISDNDFDDSHKAGSDLKGYFFVPALDAINSSDVSGADTFDGNHFFDLEQAPENNSRHSFTVRYNLASGTVLGATTVPVTILK